MRAAMPNEPFDTPPERSLKPQSEEALTLRPETSLAPAADAAPVKRYAARWFGEAWGELMAWLKLERSFSGITGIVMLLLSVILLAVNGVTWTSVLPVAVSLSVLLAAFIVLFFRAPSKLDDKKRLEVAALQGKIGELQGSKDRLESELQTEVNNHGRDIQKLNDKNLEMWDTVRAAQNAKEASERERDALKGQLEELTKHKLIFEIDQRHTVIRVQQTENAIRIFANIQLRFENKDIYPLSVKGIEISLHRHGIEDVREASDVFTLFAILRLSSNGAPINKDELENMMVQERRVTPFYLIETMLAIEDEQIKAATDLDVTDYLRITLHSSGHQPAFVAYLHPYWTAALGNEGTNQSVVTGARSITKDYRRLD